MTDRRVAETKDHSDLAKPELAAPIVPTDHHRRDACATKGSRETSAERMRRLMVERVERLRRFRQPTVEEIEERLFLEDYLKEADRRDARSNLTEGRRPSEAGATL